jgi:hypothetical protein
LLGIFHRSLMVAMIAHSTASFSFQGKPNAEYLLLQPCHLCSRNKYILSILIQLSQLDIAVLNWLGDPVTSTP